MAKDPTTLPPGAAISALKSLSGTDLKAFLTAAAQSKDLQKSALFTGVADFIDKNDLIKLVPAGLQAVNSISDKVPRALAALDAAATDGALEQISQKLKARAWKDILVDVGDLGTDVARTAVSSSLAEYKCLYDESPSERVRSGLNLIALSAIADRIGASVPPGIDRDNLASTVMQSLKEVPQSQRDHKFHVSKAEAYIALNDLHSAEREIGKFVASPATNAEAIAAVIRQLGDVWELKSKIEADGLIQALSAGLLRREFGSVRIAPENLKTLVEKPEPPSAQAEAILGQDGTQTINWYRLGLDAAFSVGMVRHAKTKKPVGTGFLVRGGNIIPSLGDKLCLLTNSHVVSDDPADHIIAEGSNVLPPLYMKEAEVVFEASDKNMGYRFSWIRSWSKATLDAAILCFANSAPNIEPLSIAEYLPVLDGKQRVYIIGYPAGGELSISMDDNLLIDHEGPSDGIPKDPAFRRIQYRAPTEPGSSGSPVFNSVDWSVIGLHHAGGKDIPRLNQREGSWPANEGIWMQSIREAGHADKSDPPPVVAGPAN